MYIPEAFVELILLLSAVLEVDLGPRKINGHGQSGKRRGRRLNVRKAVGTEDRGENKDKKPSEGQQRRG